MQELADGAAFYVRPRPIVPDGKAAKLLTDAACKTLTGLRDRLAGLDDWDEQLMETTVRGAAEAAGLKLGALAQPLRAALTGTTASPGIFEVLAILGRGEVLGRLADVLD